MASTMYHFTSAVYLAVSILSASLQDPAVHKLPSLPFALLYHAPLQTLLQN